MYMDSHQNNEFAALKTFSIKFMHLVAALALGVPLTGASEELTNVKVIGGFGADCTESSPANTNYLQPITFTLLESKKSGNTTQAEFEIQFVECTKGKWSKLKTIKTEFSQDVTDEIKQNYKEKTIYTQFRVEIKNTKGATIQTIPLASSNKGRFTFKIKLNSLDFEKDEETKTKFADVILMANRQRQSAADYYYEDVNWGRVRLPLTQTGD